MQRSSRACLLSGKCGVVLVIAGVFLGVALWSTSAMARRVFRWTDEKGVIHFSHSPPTGGVDYEVRRMPTARPVVKASGGAASSRKDREGLCELKDQSMREVDATTRLFTGKVVNSGDTAVSNVALSLIVTEGRGGDECLSAKINVYPSSLEPGATGTYEGEFNHPCFGRSPSVELLLDWQ